MNEIGAAIARIRSLARPLAADADLDGLVAEASRARIVALGEASHGTHEFYERRGAISRRLIEEHGYRWIGVEGDWPDCWRINEWLLGAHDDHRSAAEVLGGFERWPTWMWANREVADFLDWLHGYNAAHPRAERVGFHGLDVYSLWESLAETMAWLRERRPDALPAALVAWKCFLPFENDPQRYAWSTRLVPEDCEDEVVDLLVAVREQAHRADDPDDAFSVLQNAEVVAAAERYYRAMVRGDRESWNLRDLHMTDTVDRIVLDRTRRGRESRGLVWAHNTHVGDARATEMTRGGMWNLGELLRRRYAGGDVYLIGFAGFDGTVVAADAWGGTDDVLVVPEPPANSHEWLLHAALGQPSVLTFGPYRFGAWLGEQLGHRAIGVVYDPARDAGNFVATVMGERYDALVWCERTRALTPLHREQRPIEPELETEPTGL
ncbi:erythromycin esterase family protein [Agromyces sp. SYSU T00194]|uniref:erythromycin esterase family protein n=1 Tax=Agromyces chitinivorans TaxID=3158560 RepID=UPI003398BC41